MKLLKKKLMKKSTLKILNRMIGIHTDQKDSEELDLVDLSSVYQECLNVCSLGETQIIKSLKFDLLRITEYEHELPDLLSGITWINLFSEYRKRNKNVENA